MKGIFKGHIREKTAPNDLKIENTFKIFLQVFNVRNVFTKNKKENF